MSTTPQNERAYTQACIQSEGQRQAECLNQDHVGIDAATRRHYQRLVQLAKQFGMNNAAAETALAERPPTPYVAPKSWP
jgi:hypothetical protein